MFQKIKTGDIELQGPCEKSIDLTHKILDQNKAILDMNASLLKSIQSPVFSIDCDLSQTGSAYVSNEGEENDRRTRK